MKVHPKPQTSRKLGAFKDKLLVVGEEWSYVVMGDKTFIRPACGMMTYELDFEEVTNRPMPASFPTAQPRASEIENYVLSTLESDYRSRKAG